MKKEWKMIIETNSRTLTHILIHTLEMYSELFNYDFLVKVFQNSKLREQFMRKKQ